MAITVGASTITMNSGSVLQDPPGTAPSFLCRAFVNFDGTFGSSPFTIANGGIRASGNVSSVTDNGVGNYIVNFTTAMVDANYSAVVSGPQGSNGVNITTVVLGNAHSTTTCSIIQTATGGGGGGSTDNPLVNVAFFR